MARAIKPGIDDLVSQIDHHKRRSLVHMAELRDSLNQMVSAYEERIQELERKNLALRQIVRSQSKANADATESAEEQTE